MILGPSCLRIFVLAYRTPDFWQWKQEGAFEMVCGGFVLERINNGLLRLLKRNTVVLSRIASANGMPTLGTKNGRLTARTHSKGIATSTGRAPAESSPATATSGRTRSCRVLS